MNTQTFRASRSLLPVVVTSVLALVAPALGQVINEDIKILANDAGGNDAFGISIAMTDGVVAVGAYLDNVIGLNSGSAYLFDAATGVQIFKLTPNDGTQSDNFGNSIAIGDGVVAVGAHVDDENGTRAGSAYIFDASTGIQIAKLLPGDVGADDRFGQSVAVAGGIVAVGAHQDDDNGNNSGSVYLFNATTGAQIAKLLPSDGAAGDEFGFSVAIANGIVAVGSPRDSDNGSLSGSAYLFDATTGVEITKILPTDGAGGDAFGWSVAMADGMMAVGARLDDIVGNNSGSAYTFEVATGDQIAKLTPDDGAAHDFFGYSIAISDGIVAVGSRLDDDNGDSSGSAYMFDAAKGVQIAKLLSSDGAAADEFGISVAISDGVAAVGAHQGTEKGIRTGSAYMFTVPMEGCPADLTGDGILNFFDISIFLTAFNNGDPIADFTGDGVYDFFDVSAFLQLFAAGCP